MLIHRDQSYLLLVDVQEKLTPFIDGEQTLRANCRWLIELAQALKVPVLTTEQYPKGLGNTIEELRSLLPADAILEKRRFSGVEEEHCFKEMDKIARPQIIVIGIEAHVCVLQTAIELMEAGKQVFVVADAISSRDPQDKAMALQRMRAAKITIVTKEMVFFEWLRTSADPQFRELSKRFFPRNEG